MYRSKNAVLIIDMQEDFVNPRGALPVNGAVEDSERLAEFIKKNKNEIDHIVCSIDNHHMIDISHPSFWHDKNGNNPLPFTGIETDFLQQVRDGVWIPKYYPQEAVKYLEDLKLQNEFSHVIWPFHCIISSPGSAIVEIISNSINEWENLGNFKEIIYKGSNPLTEHFGIFCAQVIIQDSVETQLNYNIIKNLEEYDNIYLAGEARDFCVSATLKQAIKYAPTLAKKFIIMEDCMSNVVKNNQSSNAFYDNLKKTGIKFVKISDNIL